MNKTDRHLTSVQINKELYKRFRERTVSDNFTFQKLAERSMELYLSDKEFRNKLRGEKTLNL